MKKKVKKHHYGVDIVSIWLYISYIRFYNYKNKGKKNEDQKKQNSFHIKKMGKSNEEKF